VCSAAVALSAVAATPRPAAAGTCQFYCDTVTVTDDPKDISGTPGSGTVTTTDGRIHCVVFDGVVQAGSVCSFRYTIYTVTFPYTVHLVYTPSTGAFVCLATTCLGESAQATVDHTLDPPYQTEAQYNQDFGFYLSSRQLVVEDLQGGGSLSSSPAGIECGDGVNNCAFDYPYGQQVKIIATPDPGRVFLSWGYDCAAETTTTCTLSMTAVHPIGALFGPAPTPRPTPTPLATHGPGPTATPRPTPLSTGPASGHTAGPAATPSGGETPAPGSTAAPSATSGAHATAAGTAAATSGPAEATPTATEAPVGPVGATSTAFDSLPIVLAIVLAGVVIAIGIVAAALIGRRRPTAGPG
jgi:hypothetical protein